MKILFWDIELTPMEVYSWSLWPDSIPITMIKEQQHLLCYGARWYGKKSVEVKTVQHHGREDMLESLWELLDEADAVVSWNGKGFDSKHVRREFIEAGMNPPSPYKEIDLMMTARSQMKFPSNKLDYVAQALGVGSKTKHTGFQLWLDCMAGDEKAWRLMIKYQKQDVNLLVDLFERMKPWITTLPNVALFDGVGLGCVACGSKNVQKRGVSRTTAGAYQRYQCQDCGKWSRDSKRMPEGLGVETTTRLRSISS